jgi:transposase InsO family protein
VGGDNRRHRRRRHPRSDYPESVEQRFGLISRLPRAIEWLSDNGSPHTAGETRKLAREIGLMPCTTPIQRHGRSLKRDYARVSPRPDAANVLRQLDCWFEHYNTVHPQKALGYRSRREFREQFVEETTENAVGAGRRPHEGTLSGYSGATTCHANIP